MNFIEIQDFPGIIKIVEEKYQYANSEFDENSEDAFEIKTASLNLLTTIMIVLMAKNESRFELFEVIF